MLEKVEKLLLLKFGPIYDFLIATHVADMGLLLNLLPILVISKPNLACIYSFSE